MADEPRVIQPMVIVPPPPEPPDIDDDVAAQFEQELVVPSDLTFQEWLRENRPQPLPPVDDTLSSDVPD